MNVTRNPRRVERCVVCGQSYMAIAGYGTIRLAYPTLVDRNPETGQIYQGYCPNESRSVSGNRPDGNSDNGAKRTDHERR